MSTIALTSSRLQTRAIQHRSPLLAVMAWELRRFRASRLLWIQAICFFGLVLFFIWATQAGKAFRGMTPTGLLLDLSVAGTSVWGLLLSLQAGLLLLPGLLVPFVTADGVTRDLHRRTHELLMTTALPTRVYVWGRYLMGLLTSLGLAVLMLAAILSMYLLLHLAVPTDPPPQIDAVLLLWVGMIVPATILLSSVSFALGTLFPRQATLVKIVILVAWFIGVVLLPPMLVPARMGPILAPPAWYSAWDPTSAATVSALLVPYEPNLQSLLSRATSVAQAQHILLTVENALPDIGSWFGPHLLLAGLSLLLIVLTAFAFRRFRNVLNG
jgi:ABC-type transport system involved in multi-copper enzyme maturation permease subunit